MCHQSLCHWSWPCVKCIVSVRYKSSSKSMSQLAPSTVLCLLFCVFVWPSFARGYDSESTVNKIVWCGRSLRSMMMVVTYWGPWCWWSGSSLRSIMLVVAHWGPWCWWSGRSLRSMMLVVWSLTEVHDDGGRSLRSVMLVVWSLTEVHDDGGLVAHWGPWCWWSLTEVHDGGGRCTAQWTHIHQFDQVGLCAIFVIFY